MATEGGERNGAVLRTEVPANDARVDFSEYLNRVSFGGERIVVTRHGKPVAAIVSVADLEKLELAAA